MSALRRQEDEEYEISEVSRDEIGTPRFDGGTFLKGLLVGFGLAAVASVAFNLFQEQRDRRKSSMKPDSRLRSYDEAGGVLGDLSHVIDESGAAFTDAVKTLDTAFESGRRAVETVQDVIDKIREQ